MLVIAPCDHYDLLRKQGEHPRNDSGGRSGNGIVVILHPTHLSDKLCPVLHTVKLRRYPANGFRRYIAPHGGDGCHVILYIVPAGNLNLRHRHQFLSVDIDGLLIAPDASVHLLAPLEHPTVPPNLRSKGSGDFIARIEHCAGKGTLMQEDVFLGINILLHILVDIQMVGRKIGDHCHRRTLPHGDQLKAGELHHSAILGLDGLDLRQQGFADVAAQMDILTLGL